MTIRKELIDELLKECANPKDLLAEGGLLLADLPMLLATQHCLALCLMQHVLS